jgi:hypothetical protein
MHDLRDGHLAIIKRILRYVCGTTSSGLLLHSSSPLDIVAYSDADWAGCPDTRRSTSGYCVYLGGALVSWSSKRQPTVSRSSAEAEYRAVANAVADCVWLRQLLDELGSPPSKATVVFCDNISAVYMSTLQGRAKKVHVQPQRAPSRVEQKKVVTPKYKFIWRRKEVQPPKAVSSRAGQAGGCGEEGKQDLKTANMWCYC